MRWDGIANGEEFTMDEKVEARRDADLPEDNDRKLIVALPEAAEYVKTLWRQGVIDLITQDDGQGAIGMTEEQRDWWKNHQDAVLGFD